MSRSRLIIAGTIAASIATACGAAPAATPAITAAPSTAAPTEPASAAPSAKSALSIQDIDVGGRSIHIVCQGTAAAGAPTIVFEAGLGDDGSRWGAVPHTIAATTRACTYDRAGLGASDPVTGDAPTTADQVADLRAVLDGAAIAGPYVLVGHSIGAWNIVLFTDAYPDDVMAAVLVDPRGAAVSEQSLAALPPAAADEPEPITLTRDDLTDAETDPARNPEGIDLRPSAAQVIAVQDADGPVFGDRPVIVLSAGHTRDFWADLPAPVRADFDRIWAEQQQALADESTRGTVQDVAGATHQLPTEYPELVVQAILDVIAEAAE